MSTLSSKTTIPPWPTIAWLTAGLVVHRQVEHCLGDIGAERPADLGGAERAARGGAAAEILDQRADRDAEGLLDQPAMPDVAGELEGRVPCERPTPKSR